MLIALITILVGTLFGSGGQSPFVIPKVEKRIKQAVEDKDRRKELLAGLKAYKKEWKGLQKAEKKLNKTLAKMNKDYGTDESAMAAVFQEGAAQREVLHEKLIDGRVNTQAFLTPEEWKAIMDGALEVKPKQAKKLDKAAAKAELRQNKQLQAISDEIEAAFDDPVNKAEAEQVLLQFEESLSDLLVAAQEYPERAMRTMRDGRASREEIAEVVDDLETFRREAKLAFLDLRANLRALSSEDDWPKLAKALGKFI